MINLKYPCTVLRQLHFVVQHDNTLPCRRLRPVRLLSVHCPLFQFLCLFLSSNFRNFSLRPIDGCEQCTPWCYVRVVIPCPCTDNPPHHHPLVCPLSHKHTHACTLHKHTNSPFSHPTIRPSVFLPAAPWPADSNRNPFYLLISVVGISLQCVCMCLCASVSALLFMICHKGNVITRHRAKERKRDNNKEWKREGEPDILHRAHLVQSQDLPPSLSLFLPLSSTQISIGL